ncbi:T-cell ecto-ADP-ribosyltransferase 2-like [Terrapene carolina triunguis]|uniref:T-cell ecto-ADP-ribosyltransferase 2-like n=1 Tax=Terrapene triunguis TaxID=2587831 RepID=UPI000CEF7CC4|nr:T-cell ecto-ADP-ribosyltransferase 2-like [Terrapene carolina triunguis]
MLRPLLIPLTYFCLQTWLGIPQAKCEVELSMMPDAFDDQYLGCAEEMDEIAPKLLKEEKSMSSVFCSVWDKANETWKNMKTISRPDGFKDEYGIAIVAYTDPTKYPEYKKTFSTIFNDAVSGTNRSRAAYMASFQFKAFHYYLTRALQLLWKDAGGKCGAMYKTTVYRGVNTSSKYTGQASIRFGYFASSSINRKVAESFGKATFFTIHTCFGVKIQDMSYNPEQEEVLIPAYEIFSMSQGQGSNHFILQSTKQNCSNCNCAYLGGKMTQTCVYNSATRGGLAFPGVLSPSLFGGSVILVHVAALKLFAGF